MVLALCHVDDCCCILLFASCNFIYDLIEANSIFSNLTNFTHGKALKL